MMCLKSPRREEVVSIRTLSRSGTASAARTDSSTSSLYVSQSAIRGTSGPTASSKARQAASWFPSPKQMTSAWGIVPPASRSSISAPATFETPSRPAISALRSSIAASEGWMCRLPKLNTSESGAARRVSSAAVAIPVGCERKPSSAVSSRQNSR